VDDILIVYDQRRTNIEQTEEFNNMQPTIKFTIEKEQKEKNKLFGHHNTTKKMKDWNFQYTENQHKQTS
jgi:hypothetical protein